MNRTFTSAFALAIVLGGVAFVIGSAQADPPKGYYDYSVCYKVVEKGQWGKDTGDRLVLNIKKHSDLSKGQAAYSVHGKYVDYTAENKYNKIKETTNMTVATGTVVTKSATSRWDTEKGARLGLETAGGLHKTTNVTFDCTNDEDKAAPDSWKRCKIDGGKDKYTLETADKKDTSCAFFQDGVADDD